MSKENKPFDAMAEIERKIAQEKTRDLSALRDQFAAAALTGILAAIAKDVIFAEGSNSEKASTLEYFPILCYEMADRMLKARGR